ncbi:MAG: YbhB/YbcL family Raf kinase inhibitor-like protein [Pseudomonadota bacterium]
MRYLFCLMVLLVPVTNTGAEGVREMEKVSISTPAFENKGKIPEKYTCDGSDVSPPLVIGNVPAETKSLALIADDPDAPMGTWVHWVVWNIDAKTREIKEDSIPGGGVQGTNSFGKHDYGGPCPPSGTHRYFFKIYALDTYLNLKSNAEKRDLEQAMKGHILQEDRIIGLYKRKR